MASTEPTSKPEQLTAPPVLADLVFSEEHIIPNEDLALVEKTVDHVPATEAESSAQKERDDTIDAEVSSEAVQVSDLKSEPAIEHMSDPTLDAEVADHPKDTEDPDHAECVGPLMAGGYSIGGLVRSLSTRMKYLASPVKPSVDQLPATTEDGHAPVAV